MIAIGIPLMRLIRLKDVVPLRMILLMVGAIVALPIGVGFIREQVREAELRDRCSACLRQVGHAVLGYRENHSGTYPPGTVLNSELPAEKRLSWVTLLYSFFDESQNIEFLFDETIPWDSAENRVPTIRSVNFDDRSNSDDTPSTLLPYRVLTCPANNLGRTSGVIQYVGIAGLGIDSPALPKGHPRAGVFGYDRQMTTRDIKDGVGTTMMLAETSVGLGPWIAGGPTTVRGLDPVRKPYVGKSRQFGGNHRGGLNVAFADGSVRFLHESMDPNVFEALSTAAGGEPLPPGWSR
jgi:prepilin-type processing-associated H-X9-DG protein